MNFAIVLILALLLSAPAAAAETAAINAEHLITTPLKPADLLFVFGTREDERLRALTRTNQPTIDQKFVEPKFQIRLWAKGCTQKVPALAPVQSVEASLTESLTKILCPFSTKFSTNLLKTCAW